MCLCEYRDRLSLEEGVSGLRQQDNGFTFPETGFSPGNPQGELLSFRSHQYCTVQRGVKGLGPGEKSRKVVVKGTQKPRLGGGVQWPDQFKGALLSIAEFSACACVALSSFVFL